MIWGWSSVNAFIKGQSTHAVFIKINSACYQPKSFAHTLTKKKNKIKWASKIVPFSTFESCEIRSKFHILNWLKQLTARDVLLLNKFRTQNTVQQFTLALVKHQNHILHLLINCCPVFSFCKKVTLLVVVWTRSAQRQEANVFSSRYRTKQALQYIYELSRYLIVPWLSSWLEYFYHCVLLTCC